VASDQEKNALDEDLDLWEEQRHDPFDDILLIVITLLVKSLPVLVTENQTNSQ
jgi:hypothetical protein